MAKAVYEASDGSKHATEKAAVHWEKVVDASNKLENAVRAVQRLLAESATTADGEQLDLSRMRDYWFIADGYVGMPRLNRISLSLYNLSVDRDRVGGALVIRQYDSQRGGYVSVKARDLYADESKAEAALVVTCEKRLADFNDELAEIRKRAKEGSAR